MLHILPLPKATLSHRLVWMYPVHHNPTCHVNV